MKRLSDRFLQLGVVFALAGMGLGVWMGSSDDIVLAPVHAHVNLLGWVSMTLYGLFYRVVPTAANGLLPTVHFWMSILSLLAMIPILSMLLLGDTSVGMLVGLVSIALWLTMLVFAIIVFRATWRPQT